MEKKEKIQIVAGLLRESIHYVNNEKNGHDHDVVFDFIVSDDGEEIEVFRASVQSDAFYWCDVIEPLMKPFGLSSYVHMGEITFGQDKYGNEMTKKVICVNIH